ncbi:MULTISPECIES: class I SAM-dependent methyltransferase [unclassified Thioalkalivibrio]|uniref:class I SAM-dependent methyltransferase n=1 Tax=unclassified Thioalkalivibrio TaxID=2621013 RepID=UPI00039F0797|nr:MULTISPECIES: class I SAM-dependent methyltransferase [unclassified Thioalkalivibrio]
MKDFYSGQAERFFSEYEALTFENVHAAWKHLLPDRPGFAMDVGAGSGRDAAALAERGWEVLAVEPSDGLKSRGESSTRDRGLPVQWMADQLPDLSRVRSLSYQFDLILVSAVWMHLPEHQRERAFRILANLLAPGGVLVITLRHGASPDERTFHPVSRDELEHFARQQALVSVSCEDVPDTQGRPGVSWETVVFRLADDGTGVLPLLRHIIVNDDKSSTYKLALLRAVVRLAEDAPGLVLRRDDDRVEVPFGALGLYWIKLYMPLLLRERLKQLPRATPGFAKSAFWALGNISPFDLRIGLAMDREQADIVGEAIDDACQTIKNMPVRYTTYPGTSNRIFEVAPGSRQRKTDFDRLTPEGLERFGVFRIPTAIWDCCSRYACWLEPAIVNEWIGLLRQYNRDASVETLVSAMEWEEGIRQTYQVRNRVQALRDEGATVKCVWTETALRRSYDVDHCFPWIRWRNNDYWNLLPASRRANNSKGDRLPSAPLLERARPRILDWWQHAYVGTELERPFLLQARAALPVEHPEDLEGLFDGVLQQRLRLKMNQRLAEWHGLAGA